MTAWARISEQVDTKVLRVGTVRVFPSVSSP